MSILLFQGVNFHLLRYPTITFCICFLSLFLLQTEQFVHTLKDELVKSALLALHAAQPGYVSKNQKQTPVQAGQHQGHIHQRTDQNQSPVQGLPGHSPASSITESTVMCNNVEGSQTTTRGEGGTLKHQDSIPHHKEYDEEEWVSPTSKSYRNLARQWLFMVLVSFKYNLTNCYFYCWSSLWRTHGEINCITDKPFLLQIVSSTCKIILHTKHYFFILIRAFLKRL